MWVLSDNSKKNRDGIDERLIQIGDVALGISVFDFGYGPYSGLRTADEQNGLFLDGKSKCDGFAQLSDHQHGRALDFYAFVNGHASWEPYHLSMVACAHLQAASILGYGITWGGHFKPLKTTHGARHGWDMPHIQLIKN